jgi:hypothetical protein
MEVGLTLFFECKFSTGTTIPMLPCLTIFQVTLQTIGGVINGLVIETLFADLKFLDLCG